MESQQTNDALGEGGAADARHSVQHLDMPELDIPDLGKITSTFEQALDVTLAHTAAPSPIASPVLQMSDSPESVTRGVGGGVGMSVSPESDVRTGIGGAGMSVFPESDGHIGVYGVGMSVSPESVTRGVGGGVGMSVSPESDTLGGDAAVASLPQAKPVEFTAQPKAPGLLTQEMSEVHARSYAASIPHPTGAAAAERPPQIPLAPVKRVQAQFNPLADVLLYLVVFVGGFLGAAMRFGLGVAFPVPLARHGACSAFHIATFIANMIACLLLAMITICVSHASWLTRRVKQLVSKGVGLGVCGGCSTLSTLGVEELTSLRGGEVGGTVLYVLLTFVCGALCSVLGVKLGLLLTSRRKSRVLQEAVRNAMRSDGASGPVIEGMPQDAIGRLASGGSPSSVDAEALIAAESPIVVDKPVAVPSESSDMHGRIAVGGVAGAGDVTTGLPAFEPASVTDEIPLVGDLTTGEVVEVSAPMRGSGSATGPATDSAVGSVADAAAASTGEIPVAVDTGAAADASKSRDEHDEHGERDEHDKRDERYGYDDHDARNEGRP